jgi:hypothetical protein
VTFSPTDFFPLCRKPFRSTRSSFSWFSWFSSQLLFTSRSLKPRTKHLRKLVSG